METKIYTAYDTPPKVLLTCLDKSRARQSEAAAVDINNIVKRFDKTGLIPVDQREGLFEDVSQMGTYHDALNAIHAAEQAFDHLPARIREKFNNNSAEFLDFTSKEENHDEMRELGMLPPLPSTSQSTPDPVEPVEPAPDPAPIE